jgi:hypothetical protein
MSLLWVTAKDAATTEEVRASFEPVTQAMYAEHGHGRVKVDWHDDPVDLHSPSCAGSCDQISERAQEQSHGRIHPVPGRMRMSRPHAKGKGYDPEEHVVLVHKNHVIDYTLRQFEPHAEVPHIQPIKDYMRERGFTHAERD